MIDDIISGITEVLYDRGWVPARDLIPGSLVIDFRNQDDIFLILSIDNHGYGSLKGYSMKNNRRVQWYGEKYFKIIWEPKRDVPVKFVTEEASISFGRLVPE